MNTLLRTITLTAFLWVAVPTAVAIIAGAAWIIIALDLPAWTWLVLLGAAAFELATIVGFQRIVRRSPALPEMLSVAFGAPTTLPEDSDDRVAT